MTRTNVLSGKEIEQYLTDLRGCMSRIDSDLRIIYGLDAEFLDRLDNFGHTLYVGDSGLPSEDSLLPDLCTYLNNEEAKKFNSKVTSYKEKVIEKGDNGENISYANILEEKGGWIVHTLHIEKWKKKFPWIIDDILKGTLLHPVEKIEERTSLKFMHPLTGSKFDHPVLIYRDSKDNFEIVSEKRLANRLFYATEENKNLSKFLSGIFHGSVTSNFELQEKDRSIINFTQNLDQTKTTNLENELIYLNDSEKKQINIIIHEMAPFSEEVVMPESIAVDKYGRMFPPPLFCIKPSTVTEEEMKKLQKTFLKYLVTDKEVTPLIEFSELRDTLNWVNKNSYSSSQDTDSYEVKKWYRQLGAVNKGFVLINEDQLHLPEPEEIHKKIYIDSFLGDKKKRLHEQLLKIEKLLPQGEIVSIITPLASDTNSCYTFFGAFNTLVKGVDDVQKARNLLEKNNQNNREYINTIQQTGDKLKIQFGASYLELYKKIKESVE